MGVFFKTRLFWLGVALAGVWLACPGELWAHGVYIFGWGEGDRICTDSYFSRSNKVQGGLVRLKGPAGQILAEGQTNENGEICFPRPQVEGDYLLEVEAGEGHRAEFTLRAADLPPLESGQAVSGQAASQPGAAPDPIPDATPTAEALSQAVPDLESLRLVIREELRSQLSPLNKFLAESRRGADGPPGAREIVGGLGWLVGVFSLAYWLMGRRKAKRGL
ncbi:MAG: hypothetical protein LBR11_01585 [Deltaproteobacteria bacterium]|jgi:nickel transport protein|nr:hypothetical protein [Deltaproteobacteria bacterium]